MDHGCHGQPLGTAQLLYRGLQISARLLNGRIPVAPRNGRDVTAVTNTNMIGGPTTAIMGRP